MQQCSPSQLDHRWGKSTVVHRTTRTVVVHRRGCLRRGTGKTWTCTEGGLDRNVDLPGHCSGKSTIVYRATPTRLVSLNNTTFIASGRPHLIISSHLSLNRGGRWGTTDNFATSFLHFSLFSTALWDLANFRPVHSLILSSHLYLCLLCLLPPFTLPCKMVLGRR